MNNYLGTTAFGDSGEASAPYSMEITSRGSTSASSSRGEWDAELAVGEDKTLVDFPRLRDPHYCLPELREVFGTIPLRMYPGNPLRTCGNLYCPCAHPGNRSTVDPKMTPSQLAASALERNVCVGLCGPHAHTTWRGPCLNLPLRVLLYPGRCREPGCALTGLFTARYQFEHCVERHALEIPAAIGEVHSSLQGFIETLRRNDSNIGCPHETCPFTHRGLVEAYRHLHEAHYRDIAPQILGSCLLSDYQRAGLKLISQLPEIIRCILKASK